MVLTVGSPQFCCRAVEVLAIARKLTFEFHGTCLPLAEPTAASVHYALLQDKTLRN